MTDEERRLWWYLKEAFPAVKWRRQEPLGRFIVDFVCYEYRLIVEVDGNQHAGSAYDRARDAWLRSQGFVVVRVWNDEVVQEMPVVLDTVSAALASAQRRKGLEE